jgi:hypothetical protein
MNDIERAIRIIKVKEPRLTIENDIYKMTRKIISQQTGEIEDFMCQEVVKCIPPDVTDILLLDKDKIKEILGLRHLVW